MEATEPLKVRGNPVSEGAVANSRQQTEARGRHEVLFPVAVGGVFLVVLVIGALVG